MFLATPQICTSCTADTLDNIEESCVQFNSNVADLAAWAPARGGQGHPGKNQGGHCPPWKF